MSTPAAGGYRVTASREVFAGRVISLRVDTVQMSDGALADREVVAHPGAVAVVALDADGQVVTVSQYRHPVASRLLELPAGLLDVPGEPALAAAQRELAEEAALLADQWWTLIDLLTSPGMSSEAVRVFLARGLREVPPQDRFKPKDEELTMTVRRVALPELVTFALDGRLQNGIAVAGVLAADRALARGLDTLRPAPACWPARPEN
jgi:ADP-ribose pyrophosphatase